MKLWNVIIVHDVFALAESPEKAREVILAAIHNGELPPCDQNAIPVNHERSIREAWREQKPFVAEDVSDKDFESIKGKTTLEIFGQIFSKMPVNDVTARASKK